jgi:hypothetical protein
MVKGRDEVSSVMVVDGFGTLLGKLEMSGDSVVVLDPRFLSYHNVKMLLLGRMDGEG